jgi:enoyl-CoA hydratase/carnithine racemase
MTGAPARRGTASLLSLSVDDGVGHLTLSRPKVQNAISVAMLEELLSVIASLRDAPLGALVVGGAGDAFCSGLDLRERDAMFGWLAEAGAGTADPIASGVIRAQDVPVGIAELPFPTIAAIRGAAIGGGLEIALACDFRIVSSDARLGLPEIRWGLIPDWGATQRLPRLIGLARAKELVLTAEPIDAETALSYGLVNRVVASDELDQAVGGLARQLAGRSRTALQQAKALLDAAHEISLADGLLREAIAQSRCSQALAPIDRTPPEAR